jgi:hypothetical protein
MLDEMLAELATKHRQQIRPRYERWVTDYRIEAPGTRTKEYLWELKGPMQARPVRRHGGPAFVQPVLSLQLEIEQTAIGVLRP